MEFLLNANVAYLIIVLAVMFILAAIVAPGTGFLELTAIGLVVLSGYVIYIKGATWWALLLALLSIVPFLFALRRNRITSLALMGLTLVLLVLGSVFLFVDDAGKPEVNLALALVASLMCAGFLWLATTRVLKAQTAKKHHDVDALIGQLGEARAPILDEGSVQVSGELWSAKSSQKIAAGSVIRVVGREGFILIVEEHQSQ